MVENKLVGIDKDILKDGLIGIIIGIGIIFLGKLSPAIGAIGIPNVQSIAGATAKFIIIVLLAPIFEELFFRDVVLDFFDSKVKRIIPYFLAALISSALFSIFHLFAYGESLSAVSGSFFTAFLMGMVFAYVRKFTNSNMGNITLHMVLNYWIGFGQLAIVLG